MRCLGNNSLSSIFDNDKEKNDEEEGRRREIAVAMKKLSSIKID
jgi:hypothetical protein